jgi:ATP adenylyltransferase
MEYIKGIPEQGCLFCRMYDAPSDQDRQNLVLLRQPATLVMLNKFPYNSGHLLVAPRRHVANLTEVEPDEANALMAGVQLVLAILGKEMSPEGFNVGANLGRIAGAGIPGHVHMHVVPRWSGDTNFMPVIGEVKVVGEHLDRTWESLYEAFQTAL